VGRHQVGCCASCALKPAWPPCCPWQSCTLRSIMMINKHALYDAFGEQAMRCAAWRWDLAWLAAEKSPSSSSLPRSAKCPWLRCSCMQVVQVLLLRCLLCASACQRAGLPGGHQLQDRGPAGPGEGLQRVRRRGHRRGFSMDYGLWLPSTCCIIAAASWLLLAATVTLISCCCLPEGHLLS
jgi:hypothetical protein